MSDLSEYVIDLLSKIAKSEGFTDYKTDVQPGSSHGESVIISGTRDINGTKCVDKLHLLCKLTPANAAHRKEFLAELLFAREALMYNKIFPMFAKFQEEKGLSKKECFTAYPKCYEAIADPENSQFVIIIEDLRSKGYAMWPKHKPVLANHAHAVMDQLGRLHGITFALKDQRPVVYEELKQVEDLIHAFLETNFTVAYMHMAYDGAIASLGDQRHIDIVNDSKAHTKEYFSDIFKVEAFEPFGVIGHGVCSNDNILYQYGEGTTDPKAICLVEWQLSRYGSPALDLHCNIFSSTDKELRDKEYHNILTHYHEALSEIVTKLGSNAEKLFSYDDLKAQLKKFGMYACMMAPMVVQVPDSGEFSEELAKTGGDAQLVYKKRLADTFRDLIDLGYDQH